MVVFHPLRDEWGAAVDHIQSVAYPPKMREPLASLQFHWAIAPAYCWIASQGETPLGYILAHPWPLRLAPPLKQLHYTIPPGTDALYIHDLALSPAARGLGVATALVQKVLDTAQGQGLSQAALISVQGTQGFWQRFGFAPYPLADPSFAAHVHQHYGTTSYVYMERHGEALGLDSART